MFPESFLVQRFLCSFPKSFGWAAQEYMHCPVILTICISIKGVLPPLKWSPFSSPFIKFQSLAMNISLLPSLTNSFVLSPLVCILSCHALRCDILQVNAYQTCQDPTPSSQRISSTLRSHTTYFERALKTHATHSKLLKLIFTLSTSFVLPFVKLLSLPLLLLISW